MNVHFIKNQFLMILVSFKFSVSFFIHQSLDLYADCSKIAFKTLGRFQGQFFLIKCGHYSSCEYCSRVGPNCEFTVLCGTYPYIERSYNTVYFGNSLNIFHENCEGVRAQKSGIVYNF